MLLWEHVAWYIIHTKVETFFSIHRIRAPTLSEWCFFALNLICTLSKDCEKKKNKSLTRSHEIKHSFSEKSISHGILIMNGAIPSCTGEGAKRVNESKGKNYRSAFTQTSNRKGTPWVHENSFKKFLSAWWMQKVNTKVNWREFKQCWCDIVGWWESNVRWSVYESSLKSLTSFKLDEF